VAVTGPDPHPKDRIGVAENICAASSQRLWADAALAHPQDIAQFDI
jgi:hypothetical protein